MRRVSAGLGVGSVVFGMLAAVFPRWFARQCGIGASDDPTVATAIRSVGIRDVVIGLGLVQAARERNRAALRRWVLARAACDTGDTLAVSLALAAGARNPRFIGLGALAVAATVVGAALARATR